MKAKTVSKTGWINWDSEYTEREAKREMRLCAKAAVNGVDMERTKRAATESIPFHWADPRCTAKKIRITVTVEEA